MACGLVESRTDKVECFKMRLPLLLASGTRYIRRLFGGGPETLETKCSNLLNRCCWYRPSIWKDVATSEGLLVKHFLNDHNVTLCGTVSLCNEIGVFLIGISGASNNLIEGWMIANAVSNAVSETTSSHHLIAWSVIDISSTATESAEVCAVATCLIYELSSRSLAVLDFLNETGVPVLLSGVHEYDVSNGRPEVLSRIDYPNLERIGFYNLTPKFRRNYRKGSSTPIDAILKEMRYHD